MDRACQSGLLEHLTGLAAAHLQRWCSSSFVAPIASSPPHLPARSLSSFALSLSYSVRCHGVRGGRWAAAQVRGLPARSASAILQQGVPRAALEGGAQGAEAGRRERPGRLARRGAATFGSGAATPRTKTLAGALT